MNVRHVVEIALVTPVLAIGTFAPARRVLFLAMVARLWEVSKGKRTNKLQSVRKERKKIRKSIQPQPPSAYW